ncbi:hypothetical protein PS6_001149 [Mucor atramentarius]
MDTVFFTSLPVDVKKSLRFVKALNYSTCNRAEFLTSTIRATRSSAFWSTMTMLPLLLTLWLPLNPLLSLHLTLVRLLFFVTHDICTIFQERLNRIVKRIYIDHVQLAVARQLCFQLHWLTTEQYHALYQCLYPGKASKASSSSIKDDVAMNDAPCDTTDSQTAASSTSSSPADGVSAPLTLMSTNMQNNSPYANIMPNYDTNQPSFMNNSNLNIGSLNCRSLCRSSSPETGADFIRYLRSLHLDILCVQETQAIGTVQEQLTLQLQASSALWTPYCGIISFNPLLTLLSIDVELGDRLLVCQVSHVNALFPPITLVNLYALAAYSPRVTFFRKLLALPLFNFNHLHSRHSMNSLNQPANIDPTAITPMLILGDFNCLATAYIQDDENYSTNLPRSTDSGASVHQTLHHLLNSYFFECTPHSREKGPMLPTFRRGSSQSTIDYLYASPFLYQHLHSPDIVFLSSDWTDHALLRSRFVFSSDRQGPGVWRANPSLVTNPYFTDTLYTELDKLFNDLSLTNDIDMAASLPTSSPQDNWDSLKSLVKRIAFRRKRNRILRTHSNPSTREFLLQPVERQIGANQVETTQNQRLRASQRWREQGETSAGYLKRTINARAIKRSIDGLIDPTTNLICTSPYSMPSAAFGFYEQLYSTNPVDTDSIDQLCHFIPESDTLQASDHPVLLCPFIIDDLLHGTHRTSPLSSPGVDGIPYPILSILFQHYATAQLALRVFNDALSYGIFPSSWLKTCMCLLPKKGDL